jgi:hypothetical protein
MNRIGNGQGLKILGAAIAAWGFLTALEVSRGDYLAYMGLLPGFAFLGFTFAVWLKRPGPATKLLALAGTGCSLVFLTGPVISQPGIAAVLSVVRSGLVLTGFAAMLHFLLLFPGPSPFAAHGRNTRLLYLPAFLFWALVSYRALLPSAFSTALDTTTYVLSGLITGFYLLTGVIVFLRRYISSSSRERRDHGLRLVLWGSLLGFIPAAIGYMPVFSSIPGSDYLIISMVLPPLGWAMGASRAFSHRSPGLRSGTD